jgi:hypothetical protein
MRSTKVIPMETIAITGKLLVIALKVPRAKKFFVENPKKSTRMARRRVRAGTMLFP